MSIGLNFISLYKLQAETYNTHYDNNTEHLHNRDSEESQNESLYIVNKIR